MSIHFSFSALSESVLYLGAVGVLVSDISMEFFQLSLVELRILISVDVNLVTQLADHSTNRKSRWLDLVLQV